MRKLMAVLSAAVLTATGFFSYHIYSTPYPTAPSEACGTDFHLTAIGPGLGIGIACYGCCVASARQPEMAGNLRTTAIIISALIEGVCFFGAIICLLAVI